VEKLKNFPQSFPHPVENKNRNFEKSTRKSKKNILFPKKPPISCGKPCGECG
jgi:hypothetical protein